MLNLKRKIVTYQVPVSKTLNGVCNYNEDAKVQVGEPEIREINLAADIQRLAVEISQENSRAREVVEAILPPGKNSTVEFKYLL